MSAEVLREAAALMRERAEAATPSPWVADRRMVVANPGPNARYVADCYDESEKDRDDQHIASWHPAVALAVADWLDAEAASIDALAVFTSAAATVQHEVDIRGASITVGLDENGGVSLRADTSRPAITVARAYLGRDA